MEIQKFIANDYDEFLEKFKVSVPDRFNFYYDVLLPLAQENPDKVAVVHVDDRRVRRDHTFAWLAGESARLANSLAAKGIGKGDRVMLILFRRIEFWLAMLALHALGAVAIPAPGQLTAKDIVFRNNRARVKAILADRAGCDPVEGARAESPSVHLYVRVGAEKADGPTPAGWVDFDDLCGVAATSIARTPETAGGDDPLLIFFSSGTTGMPKMVEHKHTYPLGHLLTGVYWHDINPGDLHFTLADTGWGKAMWGKLYGQWMAGGTVFVYDFRGKFDPKALLELLAEHKVTTFCAPPTVYRFLVREDLSAYDLSSLRHCTTAGELLNESVFWDWKRALNMTLYEGYGQTETTLQIATLPCMRPKPGSIGRPLPGWDIVLLDADGNVCPPGEEGEICVRLDKGAPIGLFNCYVEEPEKMASAVCDGVYHTGDKAWVDEDGYYWFLGRVDDLIKSSGYRIGPFEVESALVAHPAVVEAAVTGVPDPLRGQAVKATVVLAKGFTPSEALTKELQEHVKTTTAPYKYPRIIDYVAELPKTISGKIRRAEIRDRDTKMAESLEK